MILTECKEINNICDKIKVRPGYACINVSIKENFRNFRLATVEKKDNEKLIDVISHNIALLNKTIKYNVEHNIYVYRVSSDIVPFVTHPYIKEIYRNKILQDKTVIDNIQEIVKLNNKYGLRLSIHPGQFNVLASPRKEVVERSVDEINEQTELVKLLGGKDVILHIGGSYGDKDSAIKRFKVNTAYIDKECLLVENDDKTYSAEEVCEICEDQKLQWVYDYHHDRCRPSENIDMIELLKNYPPHKYHLSSGANSETDRAHDMLVTRKDFIDCVSLLIKSGIKSADIMFEAKKKNKSITEILNPEKDGYWKLKQV